MQAIKAIWKNGRIEPAEPIDWPDGTQLLLEPVVLGEEDRKQGDDPESLAQRAGPGDWAARHRCS